MGQAVFQTNSGLIANGALEPWLHAAAVRRTKLGSGCHPLIHGELLAHGEVLKGEVAVAAEEDGQEAE